MSELDDLLAEMGGVATFGPQPMAKPPLIPGEQKIGEPTEDDAALTQLLREMSSEPRGVIRRGIAATTGAVLRAPMSGIEGLGIALGGSQPSVADQAFGGAEPGSGVGQALAEFGAANQPNYVRPGEEGVVTKGGEAVGSGLAFAPMAALGGIPGALAVSGSAAAQAIPDAFYGAKANGADDDTAWKAALVSGIGQGALETVLGPERLIGKIAGAMAKADRATGGLGRELLTSAAGEGVEEASQSLWADMVAQDLYKVEPDEDWATRLSKASEQAAYGALGGGVLGSVALAAERYARGEGLPLPAIKDAPTPYADKPDRTPPVYDPIERDLTPEEESYAEQWKKARGATEMEFVERPDLTEQTELGRKAGLTFLFVRDNGSGLKEGATYDRNTTIMPADADAATVGLAIATHEGVHGMPKSAREALRSSLAGAEATKGPLEQAGKNYADRAEKEGVKLSKADLEEEATADLVAALSPVAQRVMRNPARAVALMNDKPGVMVKVLDFVRKYTGKTTHAEMVAKELESLAEVQSALAKGMTGRQRVQAAGKIVEAFSKIDVAMKQPVKVKQAAKAVAPETGLVPVGEVRDNLADRVQAKGERSRAMLGEVQTQNETYRPSPITLGESQRFDSVSDEDLRARRDKAAEDQAYETDLALREAGFDQLARGQYRKARSDAIAAQRRLDMARTEGQVAEARQEVQDAARRLKRYEDKLTPAQRQRLRSTEDPEVYDRVLAAREAKAKGRFGSERALERAVPSVRYSLADQSAEDAYIKRITGKDGRIPAGVRPNLSMGDMYGMAPKGARTVATKTDPVLGTVRFVEKNGDVYALAKNPDLGEIDVIGYSMKRNDGTDLAVVQEAQGRGIGEELAYQYRKINPYAPSGGMTEAGERTVRKAYRRLAAEGVIPSEGPRYSLASDAGAQGEDVEAARKAWKEQGTESPWFKRWFGDTRHPRANMTGGEVTSKATNRDGSPQLMYHATKSGFTEFRPSGTGHYSTVFGNEEIERHGIFVTPDSSAAEEYIKQGDNRDGGNVMPVYIDAKAPLDLTDGWPETAENDFLSMEGVEDGFSSGYLFNTDPWEFFDGKSGGKFIELAQRAGYDSVIFKEQAHDGSGRDHETWVVFTPEQVKSARGNRGTFDPANPDVRYSLKGSKENPRLAGYEWRNERGEGFSAYDGGMVSRKVSDWSRSEISAGSGREIVHVFMIDDGESVKPYGRQTAAKLLGVQPAVLTKRANEAQAQAERELRDQESVDREFSERQKFASRGEAISAWKARNTNGRIEQTTTYGKDGQFFVTVTGGSVAKAAERAGWEPDAPRYSLASDAGAQGEDVEAARKAWKEQGTESPWFKRWFGASKVVDGEGKPLVVYHGTASPEFGAFDKEKIGTSTDAGYFGAGFYFVTDPEYAGMYAGEHANTDPALRERGISGYEQGGRILPVYLNIRDPYVIPWGDQGRKIGSDPVAFAESLREQGYDGIRIQKNPKFGEWYEWVAFEPEQVKSATGNRGTFSPANPDIRYSLKSDIESVISDVSEPEGYQHAVASEELPARLVAKYVAQMNPTQRKGVEEMMADADAILADRSAREKLVRRALNQEPLNEAEQIALDRIASLKATNAWRQGASMDNAVEARAAFRMARSASGRILGNPALRDALQTPAERAMALALTPSKQVARALKKAKTWQARRAIIEEEARKIERIRYSLAEKGFDPALIPDDYWKDPNFRNAWAESVADGKANGKWDWYIQWRRAAMLSGPITTVRNVTGNTSYVTYDRVARLWADALIPGTGTTVEDAREYTRDLFASLAQGWSDARAAYSDFYHSSTDGTSLDEHATMRRGGLAGKALIGLEAVGIRAQAAQDIFFRTVVGHAETRLRARQKARAEGGSVEDYMQDPDVLAMSKEDMERALFLDRDGLTRAITGARDWADANMGVPVGTTIVPFAATPIKLVQRGGETLMGPIGGYMRDREKWGGALLGAGAWAAMVWAASMFDDDDGLPLITGSRARGGQGDFQDRTAPAYSIRIGDTYYSYQQIEPLSTALAAIADGIQSGDPVKSVSSFAKAAKDKSFFRSIETVYDAVVGSSNGEAGMDRAKGAARDLLWTPMIPNVLRSPLRATADERTKEIGDRLEAKDFANAAVPTGDFAPPLRYDLWGRPASKDAASWVARVLAPMQGTREVEDVEKIDLLLAAYNRKQEADKFFSAPAVYVTRNGERRDWTEEEYSELTRDAGAQALTILRPWAANKTELTERDVQHISDVLSKTRARKVAELLRK